MKNNYITYEKSILDWRLDTGFTSFQTGFSIKFFVLVNNPCFVTNLPPFQFHIVLFLCKQALEHDHWVLHLKRAFFGIWFIEQGIFIARLVWFMAYRTRNIYCWGVLASLYGLYVLYLRSVWVKRTDRNKLRPAVLMRCTLRMCSEYGLSAMLTVCTERTIPQLQA